MSDIKNRLAAVAVDMIVDGDPLAPTLFRFLTGKEMPAGWRRPTPPPAPRPGPAPIVVPGSMMFLCSECEATAQVPGHSMPEVDAAARAAGWQVGPELDRCPKHARPS